MTRPVDPADALALFSGQAPIFPLPNVVHFPHLLLPLHIFEPRYRRMVEDVLAGDRLLSGDKARCAGPPGDRQPDQWTSYRAGGQGSRPNGRPI